MKLTKRFLAVLLAALTLASCLPMTSFSAGEGSDGVRPIRYRLVHDEGSMSTHFEDEDGNVITTPTGGASKNRATVLPTSYDARNENLVTVPKDQGRWGTCWAFSAISCLETNAIMKGLIDFDDANFSEDHLVYFTKFAKTTDTSDRTYGDGTNAASREEAYDDGSYWYEPMATLIRGSGPVYDSDYPYYWGYDSGIDESKRYESLFRLEECVYVDPITDRDVVKELILKYGSFNGFYYSVDAGYGTGNFYYRGNDGRYLTNHAITIIGWDDEYSASNFNLGMRPEHDGAWLVKNSWGTAGYRMQGGYFWLSYDEFSMYYGCAYSLTEPAKNIYQYDVGIPGDPVTFETKKVSFANVFRGDADERISDAGFYTFGVSQDYTVKVYQLESATASPTSGTLLATAAGSISGQGYHSVPIPSRPKIKKDEYFSVVVELTETSRQAGVYAKFFIEKHSDGKAEKNQSYYSSDGVNWHDVTVAFPNDGNIILRAIVGGTGDVEITSITPPQSLGSVAYGTPFASLSLPKTVKAATEAGDMNLSVTWDSKSYSPTAVGTQTVTGKVTVPDGYELKSGLSDTVTVSVTVRAAGVTTVTGDADGDGEISDWDDILLQRYLANWPGIEINLDAMDIDGDGEVSDWDDVLLQRYLAGWPIELKA